MLGLFLGRLSPATTLRTLSTRAALASPRPLLALSLPVAPPTKATQRSSLHTTVPFRRLPRCRPPLLPSCRRGILHIPLLWGAKVAGAFALKKLAIVTLLRKYGVKVRMCVWIQSCHGY